MKFYENGKSDKVYQVKVAKEVWFKILIFIKTDDFIIRWPLMCMNK